MSVVPHSHFQLSRQRKQLQSALLQADWHDILEREKQLIAGLDEATDDPSRDLDTLLTEMQQVLALYKRMVEQCSSDAEALARGDFSIERSW